MRTSFWNDQHAAIRRCQLLGMPSQEGRRSLAQIDGHVEDAALDASDQLHFRVRRGLIVQTAKRADARCTRIVDLHDAAVLHDRTQLLFTEPTSKSAALIGD